MYFSHYVSFNCARNSLIEFRAFTLKIQNHFAKIHCCQELLIVPKKLSCSQQRVHFSNTTNPKR